MTEISEIGRVGEPEPIDSETLFNLASMSKPITAVLIAILAEKGLIELTFLSANKSKRGRDVTLMDPRFRLEFEPTKSSTR